MSPSINIMIAQLRPTKGNYAANIARLGQVFAQLGELETSPDVLVLAETALTGYFLEGGVRDVARSAGEVFADLQAAYLDARGPQAPPLDIVAGFYERFRDRYYNSALYATLGDQRPTTNDQRPAPADEGERSSFVIRHSSLGDQRPTTNDQRPAPADEGERSSFVIRHSSLGDQRPTTNDQRPAPADEGERSSFVVRRSSGIQHVHRKLFLPTYGVFDEARFVEAGHHIAAFDTRYGRAAMLICEDAWHGISGTVAALDGAQVVYVVSASPARGVHGPRPDNVGHWEDLVRRIADEHGVFGVLAQLVGFEGGKGFPGASFIMGPRGNVRVAGPLWDEALVQATIDLDELPLARADLPLLADLETMLPHIEREIARAEQGQQAAIRWDDAPRDNETRPALSGNEGRQGDEETGDRDQGSGVRDQTLVSAKLKTQHSKLKTPLTPSPLHPLTPSHLPVVTQPPLDPTADFLRIDAELVRDWLVEFLRDEVQRRRGFRDVVIALSGGVDSAVTAFLCAETFGPEHVVAVRMPYRTSSHESLEHAQLVIDALGLRGVTVDISDVVDGYARLDPTMDGRRKGNLMARTRMIVLFDQSQKLGAIPIGTGNKTERLFGYYTWHADDSPPINPLGDLFKSQVWQLARQIGVPAVIVDKPASADLIVGQTDEADFGITYPLADRILHFLLLGYSAAKLTALGFTEADVELVQQRLAGTHWKRHLPSTAMLSATAIGEYYLRPLDY